MGFGQRVERIKQQAATVRTDEWHYRFVQRAWKNFGPNGHKACLYWWVRVPLALLWAALAEIWYTLVGIIAFLFGYTPTYWGKDDGQEIHWDSSLFHRYKYSPRKGRQKRFAPYQFIGPAAIAAGAWYSWVYHRNGVNTGLAWVAVLATGIALLVGIGYLISWRKDQLKGLLDKACPTLNVINTEQ